MEGDIPSPVDPPSGCTFHTRCPIAEEECKITEPKLTDIGNNHFISCTKVEKASLSI